MRFEKLMTTLCYASGCGTLLITVLAATHSHAPTSLGKRASSVMQKIKMPTTSWLYQRRYTFEIPI